MGRAAKNNPVEAAVWAAFCALALWRMAAVFHSGVRRRLPFPLSSSPGPALDFAALFVPAAVAFPLLAVIASGRGVDEYGEIIHRDTEAFDIVGRHMRYTLPVFFLPLFAGWALFSWRGLPRAKALAAGAAALMLCAAAPKLARVDRAALDMFASPFHQCFAENARRLQWTGGVTTGFSSAMLMADPNAGVKRGLPLGVFRREGAGQSFMVADFVTGSTNWVSGEFQFVVANWAGGRVYVGLSSPYAGDKGCLEEECAPKFRGSNSMMDAATARAAFGEPQEIVNCEGIHFLHYDPPLKFDFSHLEDPYLALVARW